MCVADGKAYCWGNNAYGQLGNGSTTNSSVPVAVNTAGVLAGKTVTAISDRLVPHVCGRRRQGLLLGPQRYGAAREQHHHQLLRAGRGGHPGPLSGKAVTTIAAGGLHSCALADGKAYCWGYNTYGQVGNNSTTSYPVSTPMPVYTSGVLAAQTITAINAGETHSCAVADGRAYCWGYNSNGQLGNNTLTNSGVPVAVNTAGRWLARTVTAISCRRFPLVCGGRAAGPTAGATTTSGSWATTPPTLCGAGRGEHLRGAGRKTVTAITAGRTTRVRWPRGGPRAGATTSTGSWATTPPPTPACRWR